MYRRNFIALALSGYQHMFGMAVTFIHCLGIAELFNIY